MKNPQKRGFTLLEILIAAVILAITGIAVLNIFSQSGRGILKNDERRELRYYLREVLNYVNRQPLHGLWDHFGPEGAGPSRPLAGAICLVDAAGNIVRPHIAESNPLGITQGFVNSLRRDQLEVRIVFDFFFREHLAIGDEGAADPNFGLLHMQAGGVWIGLFDANDPESIGTDDASREKALLQWRQPVMCPAIVGRPGLKLSSCPALQKDVKCKYSKWLAPYEGRPRTKDEIDACK